MPSYQLRIPHLIFKMQFFQGITPLLEIEKPSYQLIILLLEIEKSSSQLRIPQPEIEMEFFRIRIHECSEDYFDHQFTAFNMLIFLKPLFSFFFTLRRKTRSPRTQPLFSLIPFILNLQ